MQDLPGAAALPMLDVYLPMMRTAAVLAAGQLGLFETLARGPRTVPSLARSLRVPPRGLERLVDLLVQAGWLRRHGTKVGNAVATQRWFTSRGAVDYTPGLVWTADAWRLTADLAGSLRRGRPELRLWDRMAQEPGLGERFAAYMHAFARHAGPHIARSVRIPRTARRLLDVGGSHGLHSLAFCERHPPLSAVVFDHAVSLRTTKANVRAHGLQGRVTTRAGDCVTDPIGTGFDVVLYFSVAHNQAAADNAAVLAKCAAALNPGGLLVVQDYLADHMPKDYGAAFDLTLLLEVGTHTHRLADFERWIADAGLVDCRHRVLRPAAMGSVLTAKKPLSRAVRPATIASGTGARAAPTRRSAAARARR